MKTIAKIILFISVLFTLSAAGCEYEAETSETYNFMVVSSGDKVTGYYILNGDPGTWTPYETVNLPGTTYYEFKKNLTSPSMIRIFADQLVGSTTITSVQIYIYANSKEVADISDGISTDGDTVSATLYYEFTTSDSGSK